MAKGNVLQPIFKMYHQRQAMLLPPNLEELIADNHPVRVVDDVLSKIDIRPLIRQYKTGGASSYHPGMLLKVLVYAYINNIFFLIIPDASVINSTSFTFTSVKMICFIASNCS